MLKAYPGLDYESISLQKKPAAVLHLMYHSATACTVGEEENFLRLLKKCKEQQIPVYIASVKDAEGRAYATGKQILEQGAIPLLNISPEAAYGKLLCSMASRRREIFFGRICFMSIFPVRPLKSKNCRNRCFLCKENVKKSEIFHFLEISHYAF